MSIATPPNRPQDQVRLPDRQRRCVTDRFEACQIGGMLMTKLLGFIEDQAAEVINVSQTHVKLMLGRRWLSRMRTGERRRPIEVQIQFAESPDDLARRQDSAARRSDVRVRLRPLTPLYRTRDFHRRAEAILRTLREHFVAD